jgi:hypothetical protein
MVHVENLWKNSKLHVFKGSKHFEPYYKKLYMAKWLETLVIINNFIKEKWNRINLNILVSSRARVPKKKFRNFLNILTCAESEINNNTRSLPDIVSHMSPRVPLSSVNPASRASLKEREPFLSPICDVKRQMCYDRRIW